ncbi:AAA family ATPase [Skermania piniformis]|uniref:AAA family ATPase n=1 Tax=Skermania pinensis TaxID=39122 RepID=A0ABX8S7U1_9ACTN|nr:AAA family ATPase [Skermania piniformis]QXQ12635.1 AAA family ATPase [Skermania piniformis]
MIVDGVERPARVVARSGTIDVDIAVLDAPDLPPLDTRARYARVDPRSDAALPVSAHGFPTFKPHLRSVHVTGRMPLAEGRDPRAPAEQPHKLTVWVDAAPPTLPPQQPRLRSEPPTNPWSGISGAAVLFDGYLIGVMDSGYPSEGTRALTLTPLTMIDLLPADRSAALWAALGLTGAHDLPLVPNPFELLDNGRTRAIVSPAGLLRADAEVLEFAGRESELDTLETWCADSEPSVLLLHGQGGQGKTRLARAFADQLRRRGWRCGLTPADPGGLARLLDRIDITMGLTETTTPTLIMVDYAEAQRPGIADADDPLVRLIERAPRTARFLLIARSAGLWFEELTDQVGYPRRLLPLLPLPEPPKARAVRYTGAVHAFAEQLPNIDGYRGTDWATLATSVDAPTALADTRFDHLLTLYERALVDLLQAGPDPVDAAGVQDALLDHERRYWRRSARAAGLQLSRPTLTEAVAGITLFGAADDRQARATVDLLPGLADQTEDVKRRAVAWLRTLYPDPRRPWAPLEPDRLGEHLVAQVWAAADAGRDTLVDLALPSLIGDPGPRIDEHQLHQMLVVLARASTSRPDEPARQRIDAIRRAVRAADSARPDLIHAARDERREYLRLAALRAGSDLLAHRLTAAGAAPWHARWAWWSTRRPSRTIPGDGSRGLVPLDGDLLAVGQYFAELLPLAHPSVGDVTVEPHVVDRPEIGASAHCVVAGRTYAVFAFHAHPTERTIVAYDMSDGDPLGPAIDAVFRQPHFGFHMAVGPAAGTLVLLTAARGRRVQVWDLVRGQQIGTIAEGPLSYAVAVGQLAGEPVYVTAGEAIEVVSAVTLQPLASSIDLRWNTAEAIALVELPTGPAVVAGCTDGPVRVFDLLDGRQRWQLLGHSQTVRTVSVAEFQGRPIACTAGDDRTVIFWDLIDGSRLGEPYVGHRTAITTAELVRLDGRLVAVTAARDDAIRVWNVAASRYPEDPFVGHTDTVIGVGAFAIGARRTLVTLSDDRTIRTWDLETGLPSREPVGFSPGSDKPTAFAASDHSAGGYVAVGNVNGMVRVLDVVTGRLSDRLWLGHQITALAVVSGPEPMVAAADNSGSVRAWYLDSFDPVGPAAELDDRITHLRLLDATRVLVVLPQLEPAGDPASRCVIVDLTTGTIDRRQPESVLPGRIVGLDRTTGSDRVAVATAGPDGTRVVRIGDRRTGHAAGPNWTFPTSLIRRVEFAESGATRYLLVVGGGDELWVRNLDATDRPEEAPIGIVGGAEIGDATVAAAITTTDTGPLLIVGDRTEVRTIDLTTGQPRVSAGGAAPVALAATTCRDRPAVAVAVRDSGSVQLRELDAGRSTTALIADNPVITLGSAHLSGAPIVYGRSYLGTRVWDVRSWQPLPRWREVGTGPRPLTALVLDGHTLLVTTRSAGHGSPTTVEIYDVATANRIGTPITLPPGSINVSAGAVVRGHPIAVIGMMWKDRFDETLRVWDLRIGRELPGIPAPGGVSVLALDDRPDRPRLFLGRYDGTIEEWEMPGPDPPRRLRIRPGRPKRIRTAAGAPGATTLLVRPNGELVVGRGDALVLQPFAAAPRSIRLGAAIVDLAASPDDSDLVVVATEDGVVAIDVR